MKYVWAIKALAFVASGLGVLQGQPFMSVSDVTIDARKILHFTLKNQSQHVITMYAWKTTPGGTQREDFFASVGEADVIDVPRVFPFGGIRPQEERSQQMRWEVDRTPVIEVIAVIFDDGTTWGDEIQIGEAFLVRAAELHEDTQMCPELEPARWRGIGEAETKARMKTLASRFVSLKSSTAPSNSGEAGAVGERSNFISILNQSSDSGQHEKALVLLQAHCAAVARHATRQVGGTK